MKRKLHKQKIIDSYIGKMINIMIIIIKLLNPYKTSITKTPKKILIYKLDAIGDSILFLPAIKELKRKTNAKIIIVCSKNNKEIFKYHSFIDNVVPLDISNPKDILKSICSLKKEKAEIAIDGAQSSNISAIFSWFTAKNTIGFKKTKGRSRNLVYDYPISLDTDQHMVLNYFSLLEPLDIKQPKKIKLVKIFSNSHLKFKDYIIVHPCNIFPYKQWPKERWIKVIKYLTKNNKVVLIGSKEESPLVNSLLKRLDKKNIINLLGQMNIKELISLINNSKMFIGIDGGPMHIAAATGIPTIGLFGHETPVRYAPFSNKSIALYHKQPCSPCVKSYKELTPSCNNPICLKSISSKEVIDAINRLI